MDGPSAGNSTVVIHNINFHNVGNYYTKLSCVVLMHWYVFDRKIKGLCFL